MLLKLLGARVKAFRDQSRLRVAEVAAALGVDPSTLYAIERGDHPPSLRLLSDFARLYQTDEALLLTFPGTHLRHDLREQVRLASISSLTTIEKGGYSLARLGSRLKSLREEQLLRVAETALALGVESGTVYAIERGSHPPSFGLLSDFAKLYRVDEADLWTFPGASARHDSWEMIRLTPSAKLHGLKAAMLARRLHATK
jgi:transcriptional regulator with XRE-family HTH domain